MDDKTNTIAGHFDGKAGFLVSIVILNYNGKIWLKRCLESLSKQTIFNRLEIIAADNASTDGSDQLAAELIAPWPEQARLVQNGSNLGFCEGNNRGAASAKGEFLFFLNNDTWLEPDCLEKLLSGVAALKADGGTPFVSNYDDDSFQSLGARGFDLFGYMSTVPSKILAGPIFAAPGCSLLVRRSAFEQLGGFDAELFMYGDEVDLAWRLALGGYRMVSIPGARLHHRSSVVSNPKGGERVLEFRTNEMVRFLSNRNGLLVILKNARCLLLLIAIFQMLALLLEALVLLILLRSWGVVRRAYLRALSDCWRLRHHVCRERKRVKKLRRHGDLWMLRFLRPGFSRYAHEMKRFLKHGPPKVDPHKY
jgi:GT2 family glycosyltransferase